MAGAFTHFIICEEAKRRKANLSPELYRLLNKYSQFLFLGAGSPDLPYLSFETGKVNWADVMHYEKTNGIADAGFRSLMNTFKVGVQEEEIKFVWLMGYVSHLVADATVHPVVQAIVGPYKKNPKEHRLCEMTQDSIIFNEYKNNDIYYAEFSSILSFCGKSAKFDKLMGFWQTQALANYQEKKEKPHPSLWFKTYTKAVDTAEGGSGIVGLFRHLGIAEGYLYKPKDEIIKKYPELYEKYYSKVLLPDGAIGSFKDDVFERAVQNVLEAWKQYYAALVQGNYSGKIVSNWNLDTGVDMDQPGDVVTYWV